MSNFDSSDNGEKKSGGKIHLDIESKMIKNQSIHDNKIRERGVIYKNDLKFIDKVDYTQSDFQSDTVEHLYNHYQKKPKIELRIKDCEMENYSYLDLSNLNLTDDLLKRLMGLNKIKNILKKIEFLDLSTNNLRTKPDLSEYNNIKCLSISKNEIVGGIKDNNLKELTCDLNKITSIESSTIKVLCASNNEIKFIDIPNIRVLYINNNRLKEMPEYKNLEYLECINNNIGQIQNLVKLQELYIGANKLEKLSNLPSLIILNCVKNPIKHINYFKRLNLILTTNMFLSSKYIINNITKMNEEYIISLNSKSNEESQ